MTLSPQAIVDVVGNDSSKKTPLTSSASPIIWMTTYWRAILAEFVSTTLLIWFGCMSCVPGEESSPISSLHVPFAFGLLIMANLQTFIHVSGAHMNPAVTLAGVIWGRISFATGVAYAIAQCVDATVGYGILVRVAPVDVASMGVCVTLPNPNLNVYQVIGIEFCLTFVLIMVICSLWDPVNHDKHETAPIKFGLTVAGLAIAGGPLTGGGMNPARSLGPAVWTGMWAIHWVYWVGPLLGSAVATILYKFIWLKIR